MLEVTGGAIRVAEAQLKLAERRRRPDLTEPEAQLMAEAEHLGGTGPALLLPPAPRLQPGEPGQAERQLGLLAALAGQVDQLLVGGRGGRPAGGAGLVAGDQVEREREGTDRGAGPCGPRRVFEQQPPGAGLPQEQRPEGQPGDQPEVLA